MKITAREIEEIRRTTPLVDLLIQALLESDEVDFEVIEELESEMD